MIRQDMIQYTNRWLNLVDGIIPGIDMTRYNPEFWANYPPGGRKEYNLGGHMCNSKYAQTEGLTLTTVPTPHGVGQETQVPLFSGYFDHEAIMHYLGFDILSDAYGSAAVRYYDIFMETTKPSDTQGLILDLANRRRRATHALYQMTALTLPV